MDWQIWVMLVSLLALVGALMSNRVGPDIALVATLALLTMLGIVSPPDAIAGFANPAVVTIAAMFVIAAGLVETGAVEGLARRALTIPKSRAGAQLRIMAPVAALSAIMNNTPVVAMLMPVIGDWSRRSRISPSALFMPLSFAAILGGACTLIGTSSNIAVVDLYLTHLGAESMPLPSTTRQFWMISAVGIPGTILGVAFIAFASGRLLPDRRPTPGDPSEDARRYTAQMRVESGAAIVGRTVESAGLRQLPGLFLAQIERDGRPIPAVGPEEVLHADDVLLFVGVAESVVDLRKIRGLVPDTDQIRKLQADHATRAAVEAVISHTSPLVGQTIREAQFRTRYNAAVVAVHRGGERITDVKIGDIKLQPGDILLVETHRGFVDAHRHSSHFYLVSQVGTGSVERRHERAPVALAIVALFVLALALPVHAIVDWGTGLVGLPSPDLSHITPLTVSLACAVLMVLTRCCSGTVARSSVNWQVIVAIGAAIGIGNAMRSTGVDRLLSDGLTDLAGSLGPRGLLLVIFLLTNLMSQLITNKAAAVLLFPVAMGVASKLGVHPEPFAIAVMTGAAFSLMTPVGFQTNLMVLGPGGYKATDYARLGLPLTILLAILATVITPLIAPF